jgi:polysaccharide pyruvyl transferase WcaK-like protein
VVNKKKYTIAISGFFGDDNVGDDLLQLAAIRGIQKTFKYHRIVVFTSNVERNIRMFEREGLYNDVLDIVYSGRWGLREPDKRNLTAYSWITRNLAELRQCDLHLIGPGNMIKDNTNPFVAAFWILRGYLSHLLKKPFALFAVGVADVNHFHSKFLIKKLLNKACFITTRDHTSLEKLRQLSVGVPHMYSFPDLTYTLIDERRVGTHKKSGKIRKVGLNFANFSRKFFPEYAIEDYKHVVLEFLQRITEDDSYELVFFPFSGVSHFNDNIMYDRIAAKLLEAGKHISKCTYMNIGDLKRQIAECDAFIGTRFHSVVFAVQACVPTIAISYDWKAMNFLREAGFGDYAVQVDELNIEKLLGAWNNLRRNYSGYLGCLRDLNKAYYFSSLKHFEVLKDHIRTS